MSHEMTHFRRVHISSNHYLVLWVRPFSNIIKYSQECIGLGRGGLDGLKGCSTDVDGDGNKDQTRVFNDSLSDA
ncbi:hypothetical protein SCA6_019090 [Theobroma cacao]